MKNIIRRTTVALAALLLASAARGQGQASPDKEKTYDVGEIACRYALSPTGATTWQVPIDIPAAPDGFQPQISLNYNSQGGDGPLGWGWSIGGLSAITHVGGTIYYDGATSPLNVNEDRLALDGMRLVKSADGGWETEQGFTLVTRITEESFRARYANGNVGTFQGDMAQTFFCYPLTEMTNSAGGSIRYTYSYRGNLPHVSKVEYGKSDKDDRYINAMRFIYDNDRTPITRYADGRRVEETERLREIEVTHAGELWRRYLLEYDAGGTILLRSVDCLSPDGHRLRPLRMWYNGSGSTAKGTFSSRDIQLNRFYKDSEGGDKDKDGYTGFQLSRGRFSPDAKSDGLIAYPRHSTHWPQLDKKGKMYFESDYAEDQKLLVYRELSGTGASPVELEAEKGFQFLAAADVDGTGVDALVKVNYSRGATINPPMGGDKVTVKVYRDMERLGTFRTYEYVDEPIWIVDTAGELLQREFLLGDFTGNGKMELLSVSSCRTYKKPEKNRGSFFRLTSLADGATLYYGTGFDYTFFQETSTKESPDRLVAMDYNGDGKTDVCLINKLGTYVYEFTGKGFRQLVHLWDIRSSFFDNGNRELMVGDINGDGNMDFVLAPEYAKTWGKDTHYDRPCEGACKNEANLVSDDGAYRLYRTPSGDECRVASENRDGRLNWRTFLSMGFSEPARDNDGFVRATYQLVPGYESMRGHNFILMDADGDGLPDLARRKGSRIELYLNRDGRFDPTPQTDAAITLDGLDAQLIPLSVHRSVYAHGILACLNKGKLHSYTYSRREGENKLLRAMTDSRNNATEHSYANIMTDDKTYVMDDASPNAGSPYSTRRPYLYVANRMEHLSPTEDHDFRQEFYTYADAVFHREGLGFAGFRKIKVRNLYNPMDDATSTFDPTLRGAETRRETPTATIDRTYRLDVKADKRAILLLEKEVNRNLLDGTISDAGYGYDSYGQPTLERIAYRKGTETALTTEKRVTYRNLRGNVYLLGQPLTISTTTMRDDSTLTASRSLSYRADAPLPYMEVETGNGSGVKGIVTHEYDARWRVVSETTRPFGSEEGTTTGYAYDTWGRKTGETDAMGRTTRYAYGQESGLILSATDHKGRVTAYEYDGWGNPVATRLPDGSEKRVKTAWSDKNAKEPGVYSVTTTETGKPTTKVYYDELGQEVRTLSLRMDGRWLRTDKEYRYGRGLLIKESQPVIGREPSRWTTYAYDEYNRPVAIHYPGGKVDSTAYAPSRRETFRNGVRQERKLDAAGMVTEASDNGGTIKYGYRPDGQLSLMEAPNRVKTEFRYDTFGRRVAIDDPSAGTRRTVYDDRGNVAREIDADGRSVDWEYDRHGRVTKRLTPEMETAYTYDDTEDVLLAAVSTNGTATRYTYDALGRVATRKEEAPDGKWLLREYTYQPAGSALASTRYSSREGALATELYKYRDGHLEEVRLDDGTLIYRQDGENEQGQVAELATGNIVRYYEYDEAGLPARRVASRNNGGTLMDHGYVFDDATGNLTSRTDKLRNITEKFGYDTMNRLTAYGDQTVGYAPNSNIVDLGDTGGQGYGDPSMPYATTGFNPATAEVEVPEISVDYVAGDRPSAIRLAGDSVSFAYNESGDRVRMSSPALTRHYLGGDYELDGDSLGRTQERLYLGGGYYDAPAVLVKEGGQATVYYILRDYLGSVLQIIDARGNVVEENNFAPYGRRRDPATLAYYPAGQAPPLMLGRGFTGHEHLPRFGLVNMNARLYDPVLGRFLSPDPYVQLPYSTLGLNRYAYAMNNPLCYVDENGEFVWFIPVIGIIVGAYMGGVLANGGEFNPFKWDFGSADTWGFMVGGAFFGGVSALTGVAIAESGIAMANTLSIAAASFINSMGTALYTGGRVPLSISFGAFSYDFTHGSFGYLGKGGNKWYENLGYSFGAMANLSDSFSLFNKGGKGETVSVNSSDTKGEGESWWGHSSITDENGEIFVSVGPTEDINKLKEGLAETFRRSIVPANTHYDSDFAKPYTWHVKLNNINTSILKKYSASVKTWDLLARSCVGHTSWALWRAGVPNLYLFHPHMLNLQMSIRQAGIYASPYLYQMPKK